MIILFICLQDMIQQLVFWAGVCIVWHNIKIYKKKSTKKSKKLQDLITILIGKIT
jgi:hypothetical protein